MANLDDSQLCRQRAARNRIIVSLAAWFEVLVGGSFLVVLNFQSN